MAPTPQLLADGLAVAEAWLGELDLAALVETRLAESGLLDAAGGVDVIAIGKASGEMAVAASSALGARVRRSLVVTEPGGAPYAPSGAEVLVGEHPVPGTGSLNAGRRSLDWLDEARDAASTLFLISGGASSLCAQPQSPLTLDDLRAVWESALVSGADITTLNQLRASTSAVGGGMILRHVRTRESRSLIMVDNVVSGARWVASGMTYEFRPARAEVAALVDRVGLRDTALAERLLDAAERRGRAMREPAAGRHENRVVAEPASILESATDEARRRGYRVAATRPAVNDDVEDETRRWRAALERECARGGPFGVLGVGEVTVRARGPGRGGRCQEFAWRMAEVLDSLERPGVVVARASDGRDFVAGVAGAWVDGDTLRRASAADLDWSALANAHDTHRGLDALGQLLSGGHTGWNLCDLYVALVR